jgi:hypothetical protein
LKIKTEYYHTLKTKDPLSFFPHLLTMSTINGDDLFGRLRKADEVAYALITGFIKADEFNEEQSDDLQRK